MLGLRSASGLGDVLERLGTRRKPAALSKKDGSGSKLIVFFFFWGGWLRSPGYPRGLDPGCHLAPGCLVDAKGARPNMKSWKKSITSWKAGVAASGRVDDRDHCQGKGLWLEHFCFFFGGFPCREKHV